MAFGRGIPAGSVFRPAAGAGADELAQPPRHHALGAGGGQRLLSVPHLHSGGVVYRAAIGGYLLCGQRPPADGDSAPPGPDSVPLLPDGGVQRAEHLCGLLPAVGRQLLCRLLPAAVRHLCPLLYRGGVRGRHGGLCPPAGTGGRQCAAGREWLLCRVPAGDLRRRHVGVRPLL